MTFPTVQSITAFTQDDGVSTTYAVTMPATVDADDLLIIIMGTDRDTTATPPTGWTELQDFSSANSVSCHIFVIKAVGNEDGGTADVVLLNNRAAAAQTYRITGWSGTLTDVEVGADTFANNANPNPPSLTATAGADDNLWIAVDAVDDVVTVDTAPTSYTNLTETSPGSVPDCGLGTARRELNAATEDPGTFTNSASDNWIANTIVIPPVAAAAAVYPPFPRRQRAQVRM